MEKYINVVYKEARKPALDCTGVPTVLTDETMQEWYDSALRRMKEDHFDTLAVYVDLERGNNFEYLAGFLPRFEEVLLVLNQGGTHYMMMGSENLNKVLSVKTQTEAIHAPYFSLSNQPMRNSESLTELLKQAGIAPGKRIGLVGWKYFTSSLEDNTRLFDAPSYVADVIREIAGETGDVVDTTHLFIGNRGVRHTNNVNEIEHYEFGTSLASSCMLRTMNLLDEGVCETALGESLNALGQKNSVVTIAAAGKCLVRANIYPTENKVKTGDTISLTIGYKGGLSSRVGYAAQDASQLLEGARDYVDAVVKLYYGAMVEWLEQVHCGMAGGRLCQRIDEVFPKAEYHRSLCPGYLTADEEWMPPPVYAGSGEALENGMLLQIDTILSVKGYARTGAENTVALADEALKQEIQKHAPELRKRMMQKRSYLKNELSIRLNPDILPMCSTVAHLRPLLFNKVWVMSAK